MVPPVYAVAAVMVAAGVYLIDPAIADLGVALRAERTAFVGAFLIFAGGVLALSAAAPAYRTGNLIVDLAVQLLLARIVLFTLALIEIVVGAQALFADPRNDWAVLLLIPGALSLLVPFADTATDNSEEETESEDDPTTSQTGKIDVAASARFSAVYGLFYALGMGAVMIWIAIATWAYYRLSGAILNGETLDLASAADSLSAALQTTWPMALGLSAVCAVIVAGGGLAPSLIGWLTNRGTPDANRDLTKEEVGFIISATCPPSRSNGAARYRPSCSSSWPSFSPSCRTRSSRGCRAAMPNARAG